MGIEWGMPPPAGSLVVRLCLVLRYRSAARSGTRLRNRCRLSGRTLVRDHDGRTRHVERDARTRAAAETALKLAIRDRVDVGTTGELTPDTVRRPRRELFAGLRGKAPTTLEAYRTRLDCQVSPGLGALRIRELTVGRVDRFLQAVATEHGPAVAKMCRSVLNGMKPGGAPRRARAEPGP